MNPIATSRSDLPFALIPLDESGVERAALFDLYKVSLHEHIDATFGWHDGDQRARFDAHYADDDIALIQHGDATAGFIALKHEADSLHVSLLLLWPAHRNRGIGRGIMDSVVSRAAQAGKPVTLSCFRSNADALRFYHSLGFSVVTADEHFADLCLAAA